MKIKEYLRRVSEERHMGIIMLAGVIMTICHVYMLIDSNFRIEPMIRVCYCILFFPMVLAFGRRWIPFQLLIIAFSILYFNKWMNPTSFLLVCFVGVKYPGWRNRLFCLYGIAVLVCLGIGHRNWAHMTLHYLYCAGVWLIIEDARNHFSKKPGLVLTADERLIIRQLSEGKEMKEVEGFSQNTVYSKLKDARARNGLMRNCQLVERYREENTHSQRC